MNLKRSFYYLKRPDPKSLIGIFTCTASQHWPEPCPACISYPPQEQRAVRVRSWQERLSPRRQFVIQLNDLFCSYFELGIKHLDLTNQTAEKYCNSIHNLGSQLLLHPDMLGTPFPAAAGRCPGALCPAHAQVTTKLLLLPPVLASYLRQQTTTTCSCLSSDGRSSMVSLSHWFSHFASGLLNVDHPFQELPFVDHDHKLSADPPCNASWGAVQQKPVQADQAAPLELDQLCVVQPPGGQARLTPWW